MKGGSGAESTVRRGSVTGQWEAKNPQISFWEPHSLSSVAFRLKQVTPLFLNVEGLGICTRSLYGPFWLQNPPARPWGLAITITIIILTHVYWAFTKSGAEQSNRHGLALFYSLKHPKILSSFPTAPPALPEEPSEAQG